MTISKYNHQPTEPNSSTIEVSNLSSHTGKAISDALSINNTSESKNTKNTIKETVLRIYLLRHYPYVNTLEWRKYEECVQEYFTLTSLDEQDTMRGQIQNLKNSGKINIIPSLYDTAIPDEVRSIYETIFSHPEKIALFCDSKTEGRSNITGENLRSKFTNIGYFETIELPGSSQNGEIGDNDIARDGEIGKIISYTKQTVKEQNKLGKNIETIVIIGNRSYAEGFDKFTGERSRNHKINEIIFEKNSYLQIDYAFNGNNEYRVIKKDTSQITITPHNMAEIVDSINTTEQENAIRASFPQNVQNQVNRFFCEYPEKYEEYIYSKSLDLRVFCIVNLIKNGKSNFIFEKLETIFQQEDHENKIKISKIILDTCSDGDKKHMLDYIAQISNLVSEMELGNLAYYANYQKYVKKNIEYIRNKTLDERFKSGENNIISLQFNDEKIKSIDDIIQQNELIIIEGESGTGKSIKLFEIMECLKPMEDKENKYFPIYLNLGEFRFDKIPGELERQCTGLLGKKEYIFLYLFDAVDESKYDNDTKIKFFEYIDGLQKAGGKVIVTSRPGTKPEYKGNEEEEKRYDSIKKIGLEKFSIKDIENYIRTHLSDEKIEIWNNLVNNNTFINDLKDSPLMLCIICNLIESGTDTDNIKTKTDLYKKIVEKRLLNWEEFRKSSNVDSDNIKTREELLCEIAYNSLIKREDITETGINKIIKSNKLYSLSIPKIKNGGQEKYDLEPLNMIFRKNNNEEFDFVHQSFKEYFAAEFVSENMESNPDYDYENFLRQDYKNFSKVFLMFLIELLEKNKKLDKFFQIQITHKTKGYIILNLIQIRYVRGVMNGTIDDNINLYNSIDAYISLYKEGGDYNLSLISEALEFYNRHAQWEFINKIINIGGDQLTIFLKKMIKNFTTENNYYWKLQSICLYNIGKIGGPENLEFIKQQMIIKEPHIKIAILKIIYIFGGDKDHEWLNELYLNTNDAYVKSLIDKFLTEIYNWEIENISPSSIDPRHILY